jgi:hypothetical protein
MIISSELNASEQAVTKIEFRINSIQSQLSLKAATSTDARKQKEFKSLSRLLGSREYQVKSLARKLLKLSKSKCQDVQIEENHLSSVQPLRTVVDAGVETQSLAEIDITAVWKPDERNE